MVSDPSEKLIDMEPPQQSLVSLLPSMDMQPEPEDSDEENPFGNDEEEEIKESNDKPRW